MGDGVKDAELKRQRFPKPGTKDPANYQLYISYYGEAWYAEIRERGLGGVIIWRSVKRGSPEGAAYLAKRWYMGKADVKEKRNANRDV